MRITYSWYKSSIYEWIAQIFSQGIKSAKLYCHSNSLTPFEGRSNSPKLIKNYNRNVAAYSRSSMSFIAIETSKLPLCTQLIEFPSNPTHAINALITWNIRPRFDKTVTKSVTVLFQSGRYVPPGSKCIRFKWIFCDTLTALFIVASTSLANMYVATLI